MRKRQYLSNFSKEDARTIESILHCKVEADHTNEELRNQLEEIKTHNQNFENLLAKHLPSISNGTSSNGKANDRPRSKNFVKSQKKGIWNFFLKLLFVLLIIICFLLLTREKMFYKKMY
ncbi:hypothetical protein M0813_11618 [Anaeramoeba flamelloides]|uniref:Uncharacterized protein n=1 Tax=Anaeramoeba flamelloides TaxID=1746091 RepID=A0ABQ8ZE58_9EUKA|nr:hypothetical protein M0813_11618 [Anaeramoeba flamelloides]